MTLHYTTCWRPKPGHQEAPPDSRPPTAEHSQRQAGHCPVAGTIRLPVQQSRAVEPGPLYDKEPKRKTKQKRRHQGGDRQLRDARNDSRQPEASNFELSDPGTSSPVLFVSIHLSLLTREMSGDITCKAPGKPSTWFLSERPVERWVSSICW